MMQDSVETTEQVEALVNTLQIEGASLSDANLSSLSSSDLEQLADLQAELDSINASDIDTSVENIEVKQMLDGDIVETEIGGEEVVIETEELEDCVTPDEILPDYKDNEEGDVEEQIQIRSEAPPPPLRPLTIAPKPVKVPQMTVKTAAVVNQGQQIVLIQSPGGTTSTVNLAGQQIKLLSAQGQSVTIPNQFQNVQLTKQTSGQQMVQLRAVPKSSITTETNQQFKGAIKKIVPQTNKNIITKVIMGQQQQQIVQINNQDTSVAQPQQQQQIKLVTTSIASGSLPANAKTITLAQAQQMGLIAGGKVQQIVPQSPTNKQTLIVNKQQFGTKTIKVVPQLKSPTKILPAPMMQTQKLTKPGGGLQRVIIKQGNQLKTVTTSASSNNQVIRLPAGQTISSAAAAGQIHQINVPGKGVQYIRFMPTSSVSNTSTTTTSATITNAAKQVHKAQVVPVAGISVNRTPVNKLMTAVSSANSTQNLIKVVPLSSAQTRPVAPKPITTQRVLIPASQAQARTTQQITTIPASALSQLQGTILPSGNNVGQIVMLPAQYVQQLSQNNSTTQSMVASKQQNASKLMGQKTTKALTKDSNITTTQATTTTTTTTATTTTPPSSNNLNLSSLTPATASSDLSSSPPPDSATFGRTLEPNGIRPRKPCNCTKSLCLKLYCDCFANGEFCHLCNCMNCYNNLEHEEERSRAIRNCLERNPNAFRPKIGKGKDSGESSVRKHTKGCNCKRSGCLKNYCECYEAKIACSSNCKCIGCRNIEDSMEKKNVRPLTTLMPDAHAMQVVPQAKSKHTIMPHNHDVTMFRPLITNTSTKSPSSFMSTEVIEATTQCLIARAEESERTMYSDEVATRIILEEFGRCLVEIIECANKAAASSASNT